LLLCLTLTRAQGSFQLFFYITKGGYRYSRTYVDSVERSPLLLLILLQITYLDEYYLTNYEIEILKKSSAEIASQIPEGSMVIELGSGLVNFPMT